ncbi:MAG: hypothetical protein QXF26_04080 [Candidatus Bathyarchaeia archaeon]
MSLAYTPGLKRKEYYLLRKTRTLPLQGEVIVKVGDRVEGAQTVAVTKMPGNPRVINVCIPLNCDPEDMPRYMLKKEGDPVSKGEIIARKKFLWLKREYASECDGTLELIMQTSGQIVVREPEIPIELKAFIPGRVAAVIPNQGVVIESPAAFIQGIFGIGGETSGILETDHIRPEHSGRVLVGGSLVTEKVLRKAVEIGVRGIIVGGIEDKDLRDFLGYEIGVAITGHENAGLTLIITEGFGKMSMARASFELLRKHSGEVAYINGATQIRAGVIRPEIIIPLREASYTEAGEDKISLEGMTVGMPVRIIEAPFFGMLGKIASLPVELQKLETESYARVLEVELLDGRRVTVARANVEIIEE